MANKVQELEPEDVRRSMLKNTAVVQAYAEQIRSQIGDLISFLNEFQEGVSDDRK